jgi:hypothetical protein
MTSMLPLKLVIYHPNSCEIIGHLINLRTTGFGT